MSQTSVLFTPTPDGNQIKHEPQQFRRLNQATFPFTSCRRKMTYHRNKVRGRIQYSVNVSPALLRPLSGTLYDPGSVGIVPVPRLTSVVTRGSLLPLSGFPLPDELTLMEFKLTVLRGSTLTTSSSCLGTQLLYSSLAAVP